MGNIYPQQAKQTLTRQTIEKIIEYNTEIFKLLYRNHFKDYQFEFLVKYSPFDRPSYEWPDTSAVKDYYDEAVNREIPEEASSFFKNNNFEENAFIQYVTCYFILEIVSAERFYAHGIEIKPDEIDKKNIMDKLEQYEGLFDPQDIILIREYRGLLRDGSLSREEKSWALSKDEFPPERIGGIKKIRGITLRIVDAETGDPIPNVRIHYIIEKYKIVFLMIDKYVPIVRQKFLTDNNGCVYIKHRTIFLWPFQEIIGEEIYINIDRKKNKDKYYHLSGYFFPSWGDDSAIFWNDTLFLSNQEHYSAVVYSRYNAIENEGFVMVEKTDSNNRDERFTWLPRQSNLLEENDITMTIELIKRPIMSTN